MGKKLLRSCKDCKFCLWLPDYEEESHLLFCDNERTKEGIYPIGFLRPDSTECEYFEAANIQPETASTTRQMEWFLMLVNQ